MTSNNIDPLRSRSATSQVAQQMPTVTAVKKPTPIEDLTLDELLELTVEREASDLHLTVGVPPILRIDGALRQTPYERLTSEELQRMVYDILSDEQIERFERTWELDLAYQLHNKERFRVNVYRERNYVAAAFRWIPAEIPTIRELELPLIIEDLTRRARGIILVTGPTGYGKSTTLAAMVNQINNERHCHIITIEDPIEYLHTHRLSVINQREVGQDTREFSIALRAALREDPDVILVGEMRDLETIALAVTAAETGHLVLTTLHTKGAADTVDRIVDVFPPGQQTQIRIQLSNSLVAVLSQELLPRAHSPGRIVAVEVMIANHAIRNLIREAKAHQISSVLQTSSEEGMISMDQALAQLYRQGKISYEVAMERAVNADELKKLMYTGQTVPGSKTK